MLQLKVKLKPQEQSPKSTEISSDTTKGRKTAAAEGAGEEQEKKKKKNSKWCGEQVLITPVGTIKKIFFYFITFISPVVIPSSLST